MTHFAKAPEKPNSDRTKCCEGRLYYTRCINCLKWYTFDFLKEQYDKERVDYSYIQDPDEWAISPYAYGADKPGPPSATQAMLGVSPIDALKKLQEKLKATMYPGSIKTGGPTDGEESSEPTAGFDIFVEDDLFPEKQPAAELPCICKITAHGPIESKHCLWHQERKKRGEQ